LSALPRRQAGDEEDETYMIIFSVNLNFAFLLSKSKKTAKTSICHSVSYETFLSNK